MEAPTRIYASMETAHQCQGKWECVPFEVAPDSPVYILESDVAKREADAEARGMERAAEAEFPDTWRDDAHAVHAGGGLKEQRTWSAGFNACRNAIRAEAAAIRRAAEETGT